MGLSPIEERILQKLADGWSTGEAGQMLGMSTAAAGYGIYRLCRRFGYESSIEAWIKLGFQESESELDASEKRVRRFIEERSRRS